MCKESENVKHNINLCDNYGRIVQCEGLELASSWSSVKASFWMLHVSACVRLNSATAFVTVDLMGAGSPMKQARSVT
jgi:hypothetical protein